MSQSSRLAFYDFDGTLSSGDIVRRYAFFARHQPSRSQSFLKLSKLVLSIPLWLVVDSYSRRRFNEIFFREYKGMEESWLRAQGQRLFDEKIRPSLYPSARGLVDEDRRQGYLPVLVTGELDIALEHAIRYFGFHAVICNSLEWNGGKATGEIRRPLVAEEEKAVAMKRLAKEYGTELAQAKAYSDSFSDIPMLEAVGIPAAVNPDRRLRRVAAERGWPILDLKRGIDVSRRRENLSGRAAGL